MRFASRGFVVAFVAIGCLCVPARAAVTEVRGSVQTSIVQFLGLSPIQTDFNQEIVPLTQDALPITAAANLDRIDFEGTTKASAQAMAQLDTPNLSGLGNPNDVGIDLSSFSDDLFTGWRIEGSIGETRVMNLSAIDLGASDGNPPSTRASSRLLISGAMIIAALDSNTDLTDVEVNLTLSVTMHRNNRSPETVLSGDLAITGGPEGKVGVSRQAGAFEGMTFPIIDFVGESESVPLAKAVVLTGLQLPYEYDVAAGEEFTLDLSVRSQVITKPGGIGAAATFGVPQDAIGVVFEKVKHDDRGRELARLVSQHVDTTGQSYVNSPAPLPISVCGASSIEIPLLVAGMGLMTIYRGRRRLIR